MSVDLLDSTFPNWRSVELFGATAVGKTYFAAKTAEGTDVLLSPHTGGPGFAKFVGNVAGRNARRRYEHWRADWDFRSLVTHSPISGPFVTAVMDLVEACNFNHDKRRNTLFAIYRAARASAHAAEQQRRVLIDEGIVRRIVVLRTVLGSALKTDLCLSCLELYPWERNALMLTASADTRARRLKERNKLSGDARLRLAMDDESSPFAADLCRRAGWKVRIISGE